MSRDFYSATNDSSLSSTKKITLLMEKNVTTTSKELNIVTFKDDKENCSVIQSETSTSIVKQIQVHYEELSKARTSRTSFNDPQNVTSTGAIKKRKVSDSQNDSEVSKHCVPKKRAGIRDDEAFRKTRFRIYHDQDGRTIRREAANKESEGILHTNKSENSAANKHESLLRRQITDKRLDRIQLPEHDNKFVARFTPNEVPPIPPPVGKVKALYRDRTLTKSERANTTSGFVSRDPKYDLPYDDFFIEHELEREFAALKLSKNLRRQNITIEQRKIIVKFLTRLNSHLFLPSFFLYQTVKLFDAVLDAKIVDVKDFQLIALAAMWLALKREVIVYNIPSAQKMISFAKDLYEGRVDLLLKCEIDILQTLNFNIVFPDPFSILCYDITACTHSQFMDTVQIHRAYCCGSYMIDVSLFDEEMMKVSVVLLAAAAAEAALYFTMETPDEMVEPLWDIWRAPHTTKTYSDGTISTVRMLLIRKTFESQKRHNDADIVFKKYIRSRYGRISHFLGTKVKAYLNEE